MNKYIFTDMKILISSILESNAKQLPTKPAIISDGHILTHIELFDRVKSSIQYLETLGVHPEMNVALRFENPVNHLVFYLSLLKMGIWQLSLDPKDPVHLQKKNLSLTNITLVVQDIPLHNKLMESTVCTSETNSLPGLSFQTDHAESDELSKHDTGAEIIIGSGTTGEPKVFLLSSSLLADRYRRELSVSAFNEGERHYSFSELYYLDSRQLAIESLAKGMTLLLPKSKPKSIIGFCLEYKVNHLELTGSQAVLLLSQEKILKRSVSLQLPDLKSLMLTSSLISEPIREKILSTITKQLYINYGTNEFGVITVASPEDITTHPGTVGKVLPGVNVSIVKDDGSTCQVGEVGNILINYQLIMSSYLNNSEATKKTFTKEGYYPGDMGRLTKDGNLILEGRKDDMMIFSGVNIYPREIESVLESHPNVTESAVFPLHTPTYEHIPFAVVSVHTKVQERELLQWCEASLGWRKPQRIFFIKELPRNKNGKVLKKLLADEIKLKLSNSNHIKNISTKNNFYKYTQTMLPFTIRLNKDLPKSLDTIDEWLTSVLGIDIEPLPQTDLKTPKQTLALAWRILLLSRALLQSIRIPLFEPSMVRRIDENPPGHYAIAVAMLQIDHIPQKVYIQSLQTASNLIMRFMKIPITHENRQDLFQALQKEFIAPLYRLAGSGKSTMPILREAHRKNIPFIHLRNGVYQLGWGSRARRMNRSSTEADSFIGSMMSHSKVVTAALVQDAGLPAPVHKMAVSEQEALSAAKKLGWPIVVKPADSDRGEGVTVDVTDDAALIKAFAFAKDASKAKQVIIERQVDGVCCRIFIAGEKMLYAVKRLPKSVKGDGVHSVQELIEAANRKETDLPPWKKSEPFPMDEMAVEAMGTAGFRLNSIPKVNQFVPLRAIESTLWGGVDEDVSATIHPDNVDLALRASRLFGLHVAGVDLITPDITVPWYENGAIVNEVNLSPLFGGGEISRRAIPLFLEDYVEEDGRIPITVITGGKEAMERALVIQKEQVANGVQCFVSSERKSIDWKGREVHFAFESLKKRCRALLMDGRVEALILWV